MDPGAASAVTGTASGTLHVLSEGTAATAAALHHQQQQKAPPLLSPQQQQKQPLQRQQVQQHGQWRQLQQHGQWQQQQQHEQQDEQQVLLELQELLAEQDILLPKLRFGQQRTLCPRCQGGSSHEDCFAINLSEGGSAVWLCHRATCGCKGAVTVRRGPRRSRSSSSTSSSGGGASSTNTQTAVTAVSQEQQQVRHGWCCGYCCHVQCADK
jgi:hypothetical protein